MTTSDLKTLLNCWSVKHAGMSLLWKVSEIAWVIFAHFLHDCHEEQNLASCLHETAQTFWQVKICRGVLLCVHMRWLFTCPLFRSIILSRIRIRLSQQKQDHTCNILIYYECLCQGLNWGFPVTSFMRYYCQIRFIFIILHTSYHGSVFPGWLKHKYGTLVNCNCEL